MDTKKLETALDILFSEISDHEELDFPNLAIILNVNLDETDAWWTLKNASKNYLKSLLEKLV